MGLKILIATMGMGIGGVETHIVELAAELKRRGMDVAVASNGGVYVADLEAAGIRHYNVPMNKRSFSAIVKSYFIMRKIIRQEKPDVVHAHARIPAFICGRLHKTMHFPFVTTAHGVYDVGNGLKYLTDWGQKTIVVSDDIRDYLTEIYRLSENDIIVTINGIDTDKFAPGNPTDGLREALGIRGNGPVISHVSRLDESTELVADHLIGMAPELDKLIPGVCILITGGGGVFDKLNARAEAVNRAVGRRVVVMTGARTDINRILSLSDLFVGVSRAALEAMAAAKPVILAGNQGYIGLFSPEKTTAAVETNFCCRGCPLPDEALLKDEIIACLTKMPKAALASLGSYGRKVVIDKYSVKKMTDDCVVAYEAVRKHKYNVAMSGYYGFGNAGDEAILQSIHQNIKNSGVDVLITVLSSAPADTNRLYGYQAVDRFNFLQVIETLRHCDTLVSGGGSLLQDYTSTRSLLYYLLIIRAAESMGKKVMIYSNGIGPIKRKMNRWLVKKIVGRADVITLRDKNSEAELAQMGVIRDDIHITADPVFTLDGVPRETAVALLSSHGIPTDSPFICISIRDWKGSYDFRKKIALLCDKVHELYGYNIVLIPMQLSKDMGISREVSTLMKWPSYVLNDRFTAEELMGIISISNLVLAMRLHTIIFSARMKVPIVGIVYDPKVEAYLEALSMPSAGSVQTFDPDKALAIIDDITLNRDKYVEKLKNSSMELEAAARMDVRYLTELLEKH